VSEKSSLSHNDNTNTDAAALLLSQNFAAHSDVKPDLVSTKGQSADNEQQQQSLILPSVETTSTTLDGDVMAPEVIEKPYLSNLPHGNIIPTQPKRDLVNDTSKVENRIETVLSQDSTNDCVSYAKTPSGESFICRR